MTERVARLGMEVDSSSVKSATGDLDRFKAAGARAGAQAETTAAQTAKMGPAAAAASKGFAALGRQMGVMIGVMAGYVGTADAIAKSRAISSSMAEVSTLIAGTTDEMKLLRSEGERLTRAFGGNVSDKMKAFYQAISAGADGVAGAAKVLDTAGKLAIGGVTDMTTGVDALTTAINAYGPANITAAQASDALFVGMKAGKTTVGELGAALGQVIPTAAAMGVSFDEVVAGISALTTQGQSTAMATTGLRQLLVSIVKPTKQAADAAKALGLDFSTSALEAKGLAGFLEDLKEKTGGNTDTMAQLFGSVEALNAALAFAAGAGDKLNGIMGQMATKAGATDEAYQKMAQNLDQRLNQVLGDMSVMAGQFGDVLLAGMVPALETLMSSMQFLSENLNTIAVVMGGLAASTIPSFIAGMGGAVGVLTKVAAAARTAAIAFAAMTGPWGILAGLVGAAVTYFALFRGEAEKVAQPVKDTDAALKDLNKALGVFSTTYAPQSAQAALDAANEYVNLADQIHNAAVEQLAAFNSNMKLLQAQKAAGTNFFADREMELLRDDEAVEEALRKIAQAELALNIARSQRIETAKRVMNSDRKMKEVVDELNNTVEVEVKGVDAATEAKGKAKVVTDELADAYRNNLVSGIDGVAQAFGDFVVDGFNDFKGFAKNVLNTFKRMIAQMIAIAVKNKIMISLGLGGIGGTAGSVVGAAALGGGGGGSGGILSGLGLSKLLGGSGFIGGIGSGFSAALGLGGFSSSGLFAIGSNAAVASAATGASALSASIGAALAPLAAVALGIGFLVKGLSRKYAGTILRGDITSDGFVGTQDDFYKGGFLRSNKTVQKPVPDEIQAAFDDSVSGMVKSIKDMSKILKLGKVDLSDFSTEFSLWINGLSEEQIMEKISEGLQEAGDGMAAIALGTSEFIRTGEGALDALTRLASSLSTVNDTLRSLGLQMFETSLYGADLTSKLADLFGGLDGFLSAHTTYLQAFYTAEEQFDIAVNNIRREFKAMNLVMPESRSQFRAMVESIDITTEAGQELYAKLVMLAGALDQVLPQVTELTLGMQGLISRIGNTMTDLLENVNEAAQTSAASAKEWYRTADGLRKFAKSIWGNDKLSNATSAQRLAGTRNDYASTLAAAQSGDLTAAGALPAIAKTLLDMEFANATSSAQYRIVSAKIQAEMNRAAGISELEGAKQDVLTGLYQQQIEVLTALGNFLNLEGLTSEDIGGLDQSIQDMIANWDGTVASFENAMAELGDAITETKNLNFEDLSGRLDLMVGLAEGAPEWLHELVSSTSGNMVATLDFVLRRNDLSPDLRWIAVHEISNHVANIEFALSGDLDEDMIRATLRQARTITRKIDTQLTGDMEAQKFIKLLNKLNGEDSTTINFKGGFALEASKAFTSWYGETTKDMITGPMNKLTRMLGRLADLMQAQADKEDAFAAMQSLQTQGLAITTQIAATKSYQESVAGKLNEIFAKSGVSAKYWSQESPTFSVKDGILSDDNIAQLSAGGAAGYTFNNLISMLQKEFGLESTNLGYLLDKILTNANKNSDIYSEADKLDALRQQIQDLGGVPMFARGGRHRGGLRIVGERGPELEATGAATILTTDMLQQILQGHDLKELIQELRQFREEQQQLAIRGNKFHKKTSDALSKWDVDGLPPERV